MSQWEKLLRGDVYDDLDPELVARRIRAKGLFRQYNATDDSQGPERAAILRQLLGFVGEKVLIEPDFRCEYGCNIQVESQVYINFGCIILDCAPVRLGERVLLGPRVGLYAADHSLDPLERAQGACIAKAIHIEQDAWLGGDVKVLGGVRVGAGSVIGAGSVVVGDVPPGVLAVGNPCRVLRPLGPQDRLGFLPPAR